MFIGYVLVPTVSREMDLDAQERELRAAGCEKLFVDKVSSTSKRRRQLEIVLALVREGDVVMVTQLGRLARSLVELLTVMAKLEAKNVTLRVLSIPGAQPLDTATAMGKLMLAVIGAVGQFERGKMAERQQESTARVELPRSRGRPPTARRQAEHIKKLADEGMAPSDIATRLAIGRASVYRLLSEEAGDARPAYAMMTSSEG
jgi:DNA invertase Pin-like site-specific DNA recombinase